MNKLHLLIMTLLSIQLILALPPPPTEFYGVVYNYNQNATIGEVVTSYDQSGNQCGTFTIINGGFYGSLTCTGDDPETGADEGPTLGEIVAFRYKGGYATPIGDATWQPGTFKNVNLTYPVVFCGDLFCDAQLENALVCPQDCPSLDSPLNVSFNYSNFTGADGSGGQGSGSGTGGANRGSSLRGTPPRISLDTGDNFTGPEGFGGGCEENWNCTSWSECDTFGDQFRKCTDLAKCGTKELMPAEEQKCEYTPTCTDGLKNGLEEGIDCGGLCKPCIGCFDSIQNCHDGACEEDIDCGGPCPACPTCYDNLKNCHDGKCEDGVDCGGPCDAQCPGIQSPRAAFACKKEVNPFSNDTYIFFVILLLTLIGRLVLNMKRTKKIVRNKKKDGVERLKAVLAERRKMYIFIMGSTVIAIVLYLFYYYFILCEANYDFLWLLVALLVIIPLMIIVILRWLEYDEREKIAKMSNVEKMHEQQLQELMRLREESISDMELTIEQNLCRLIPLQVKNQEITEIISELIQSLARTKSAINSEKAKQRMTNQQLIKNLLEIEDKDNTLEQVSSGDLKDKLKFLSIQYDQPHPQESHPDTSMAPQH